MPTAFVLIKCEEGSEQKIMKSLNKTDVMMDFQSTVGHYDVVAKIISSSLEQLNKTTEEIRGNNMVHSIKVLLGTTETTIVA